jgi:hypothetical protein
MSNSEDHRWDLSEDDEGYGPEAEDALDQKYEKWDDRDWPQWLAQHLTFPFTVR